MPNPQYDSLQLQDRDWSLLRGLFESRVMTVRHIATLFFNGKGPYAKKRLQKFKAAGLIGERKRRVNESSVLFLTAKAFKVLKGEDLLSDYPILGTQSMEKRAQVSESTLRHEIEIMDVKAAFHAALANSATFSIVKFSTWPLLYQFETTRQGHGADFRVMPDGFIRIYESEPGTKGYVHECFLEVDRSNESQNILTSKAPSYLAYYKSGGFALRNGASRADYEKFPFRVLMVLKSAERRNNTAERLLQNNPPILSLVWLTTLAEVTTDPLGAIWLRPRDYRDATKDTSFDPERQTKTFIYRTNPEREAFIESKINKLRLLEN